MAQIDTDCLYFTSSKCFKQSTMDYSVYGASGTCLTCVTALNYASFNLQKIPKLQNSQTLMSGSSPQWVS